MSGKFQPINRDTAYLLPPSLQDWLPEKRLARFVVDIVDQLDLGELVKRYGDGGKQPYHPAVLLSLLSYGYANKLEEQLRREVQELLRRAELADSEEEPEMDIPDELARREDRLAAIKKAGKRLSGVRKNVSKRNRPSMKRSSNNAKTRSRRPARKPVGVSQSRRRPGHGTKARLILRMMNHASCRLRFIGRRGLLQVQIM